MSCSTIVQPLPITTFSEQYVEHVAQVISEKPTRRFQSKGSTAYVATICDNCIELRNIAYQGTPVADGTPVYVHIPTLGTYMYGAQNGRVLVNAGGAKTVCYGSTAAIAESCVTDREVGHILRPDPVTVKVGD